MLRDFIRRCNNLPGKSWQVALLVQWLQPANRQHVGVTVLGIDSLCPSALTNMPATQIDLACAQIERCRMCSSRGFLGDSIRLDNLDVIEQRQYFLPSEAVTGVVGLLEAYTEERVEKQERETRIG